MSMAIAKSYSPGDAESAVSRLWDESGAFDADPADPGEPYCIVIPPPNVTAALHLGHALNNTLQDVLIRAARLRGHNTLWMPGTDHAGIATQSVVEKRLLQEGRRRTDFTREAFVDRVQAWKDEYEATIIAQLKAMGCSCDWRRVRFTMDPVCTAAVREAFFGLFGDGLIYRGKRLVNWDPVTLTALADDEVEMRDVAGRMWYLRYPLEESDGATERRSDEGAEYVTVATTRPETMLGDTAVAINPKDPRAARLRGRKVRLPIVDRVVPIVEDDYVVMPGGDDPKAAFATGFLKVTPAHDPNDWEIGRRHDLAVINVMAPDATISADHGWSDIETVSRDAAALLGLSRDEARARVVEWFESRGLLEDVREYAHSVGHSYRSHVPVEPYLSDQWYVRVTDDRMRGEALRAMHRDEHEGPPPPRPDGSTPPGDGELRFAPSRYARTFQLWHENLRDWCISRQLWWGHRIPVWSREGGTFDETPDGRRLAAAQRIAGQREAGVHHVCVRDEQDAEAVALLEAAGYAQDPDVLDTWFSSALWPISTMGWPDPARFPETEGLLAAFNPSTVLVTGRDITTLWVSRMVMFNRYFRDGRLPFREVYINPMIQDGHGQRMSKSLGNGVDPRDIVHSHGADALRFVMVRVASSTQDARMPVDLVCPHCGHAVHPRETTSPAGYRVAEPVQTCPDCKKKMASAYGLASGLARAGDGTPPARNTSSQFDLGRNFANKVWNVTRFALGKLGDGDAAPPPVTRADLPLVDRWILSRLHAAVTAIEEALATYQFNVYADTIYDFVKGDFCDWYVEAVKPTIDANPAQRLVLRSVLDAGLRLLHPICPFVTEALWAHVQAAGPAGFEGLSLPARPGAPLARAAWPVVDASLADAASIAEFARAQALVTEIRNARSEHRVPPRKAIELYAPPAVAKLLAAAGGAIEHLANVGATGSPGDVPARAGDVPLAFEGSELRLSGLVERLDRDAEQTRLDKLVGEKERAVSNLRGRLANKSYVERAPAHLVDETRRQLAEAEADLAAARRSRTLFEETCVSSEQGS